MTTDDRAADTASALLTAARDAGMTITGDGRVTEADAAVLLGYAPETLAKKRTLGSGPVAYGRGFGGARISYRLDDLARWIEAGREIFCNNPD
ncbi:MULTISPECIES: hypothetical protein [unclassified Bradyrhizobium]|uniref:hypothetical protein n=1 Tax=unclassified Bradyrhizobium TaxID=2631580 RepID=UPI001FF747C5|nr:MULTISPECIES: hypothetical protein [unclassified Bradyrhizobium]MCK1539115.1 hypothetical protein [Bradyrhizobium sp. 176]MCK1557763.1 hypothetical protein [Bradyrhizobium sp. 171]